MGTTLKQTATALAYVVTAFLAEWGMGTLAIWPAAGVAVGALMVGGRGLWPGVFVGSVVVVLVRLQVGDGTALEGRAIAIALITSSGNALGAYLAASLRPQLLFDPSTVSPFAGVAARYIGASLVMGFLPGIAGLGVYYALGEEFQFAAATGITAWAAANATGVIVIAPLIYLIRQRQNRGQGLAVSPEDAFIVSATALISFLVVGPGFGLIPKVFTQPALMGVPLLWAALRRPPLILALNAVCTYLFVWWGIASGAGYFAGVYSEGSGTATQVLLGIVILPLQLLQMAVLRERVRSKQENERLESMVEQRTAALEDAKQEAERLARTDPLTGLNNRRAFFELSEQAAQLARRGGRTFSVLMIDIDHFKRVNDSYGHDVGDLAIKALASAIGATARSSDVSGRLGGEEFAVVLPDSSLADAVYLAQRLRAAVAAIRLPAGGDHFGFTVSIGATSSSSDETAVESLIKEADVAMYAAKEGGRDTVFRFQNGRAERAI